MGREEGKGEGGERKGVRESGREEIGWWEMWVERLRRGKREEMEGRGGKEGGEKGRRREKRKEGGRERTFICAVLC